MLEYHDIALCCSTSDQLQLIQNCEIVQLVKRLITLSVAARHYCWSPCSSVLSILHSVY